MLAKTDIVEATYLRHRVSPEPGDPLYLHLSDLLLALKTVTGTLPSGAVLDYGCGGSPYRFLFPGSTYHRADFMGFSGLDYTFGEDSRIDAPDARYDLVLSTQVLEHVRRPRGYLQEAHRLLRPNGRLLLSTHGTFHDHGCPHDYQRWTSDGLQLHLTQAGFRVRSLRKLTSGARALACLLRDHQRWLVTSERSLFGYGLRLLRRVLHDHPKRFDRFCDRALPPMARVHEVTADEPGESLYIALLADAEKI